VSSKKPGFSPKSATVTKYLAKTRFQATTRELQETGFSPKSATVTKYLAKTRFLATCQQLTINKKKMLPLHRGQLLQ
jgi:hypothetical protein